MSRSVWPSRTIPHAVSQAGSITYTYDCNGNMTGRHYGGRVEYALTYDAENHLTAVSDAVTANFLYDGDGNRVKGTVVGVTTIYVGNYFEWTSAGFTKYYYAGATRVAMQRSGYTSNNGLFWLFGDHLGSTSRVANWDGTPYTNGEQRYKPWGEKRYPTGASGLPTTYRFTGERQEDYIKLYWYGSRWYDDYLNRWIQPDVIIPGEGGSYSPLIVDYHETQFLELLNQENKESLGNSRANNPPVPLNPIAFDRYSSANNNPVKAVDPSGHWPSLSRLLSIGATICDLYAAGISVSGVIVEGVAVLGGEGATPLFGVDGAVGFAAGVAAYNKFLNPIEDKLSAVSAGLVAAADAFDNNHTINQIVDPISGQDATEVVLGADTTFSLGSIAVGNTPLTPDAFTDTLANVATVYYDIVRLRGAEPFWGLRQLRIVKPRYSPGYVELIKKKDKVQ